MSLAEIMGEIAGLSPERDMLGTVDIEGVSWSFATNGSVMVLTTTPVTLRDRTTDARLPNVVPAVLGCQEWPADHVVDVAALREWAGAFELADCADCNGSGSHTCGCGHVHECPYCKSSGVSGPAERFGWLGDKYPLNRVLLAKLLETAPDVAALTVRLPPSPFHAMRLEAPGWMGLMVGVRDVDPADGHPKFTPQPIAEVR